MAEVLFETFGARQLHVAVQGVLALTAARGRADGAETGLVVDAGDGATHIVPVVGGVCAGWRHSSHPAGGAECDEFCARAAQGQGGPAPSRGAGNCATGEGGALLRVQGPRRRVQQVRRGPVQALHRARGMRAQSCRVELGYERFVGPELLFNPSIFSSEFTTPLHKVGRQCRHGQPH